MTRYNLINLETEKNQRNYYKTVIVDTTAAPALYIGRCRYILGGGQRLARNMDVFLIKRGNLLSFASFRRGLFIFSLFA